LFLNNDTPGEVAFLNDPLLKSHSTVREY